MVILTKYSDFSLQSTAPFEIFARVPLTAMTLLLCEFLMIQLSMKCAHI